MKTKNDGTAELKFARKKLADALATAEDAQRQLAGLSQKLVASQAELDRLDTICAVDARSVRKRTELAELCTALEKRIQVLESEAVPQSIDALLQALHSAYERYQAALRPLVDAFEENIVATIRPWYREEKQARHIASVTDAVVYLRAHVGCTWPQDNPIALSKWFVMLLDRAANGELPWPPPMALGANGHATRIDFRPTKSDLVRRGPGNLITA